MSTTNSVAALGLAALLLLASEGTARAAERVTSTVISGEGSEQGTCRARRRRTVELRSGQTVELHSYGGRRIGGYSYEDPDVANAYGRSPPPWLDVRQSSGGPFD